MATKREDIRKLVEDLPESELAAAREALQRLIAVPQTSQVSECDRRLLESGLVDRIPSPEDVRKPRQFTPIRVEGKPVSETIIEERR